MEGTSGKAPARFGGVWRDNIEAMAMAIIMALVLKSFVVEAYKIPTGSMQPTLFGDDRANVFDRILVDKLTYQLRDPERFDVVVFRYPLDRSKNFVKRLVGMPGEELRIENGDLWNRPDAGSAWRVLRRPRAVQRSTWKALAPSQAETTWKLKPGTDWTAQSEWIRARGDGEAEFRSGAAIRDVYTDGYPEVLRELIGARHGNSAQNRVGDLRFEASLTAMAGSRTIEIELTEGIRRYTFRLPGPAAHASAKARISVYGADPSRAFEGQDTDSAEPIRLTAGRAQRIAVQNLDDLLELEVDGTVLAQVEIPSTRSQSATVRVRQTGEGADFSEVRVLRDIYYLPTGNPEVRIPAGHYFMLGDNTQDSSDSREWTFVRWEVGEAEEARVLRGNRITDNPRYVHSAEGGTELILVDEWGERHQFAWADGRKLPAEPAPFVARDLILGRAVLVFWPIQPWRDLVRLDWVR